MNRTIDTFFEPNKTIRELRAIIKKGGEDIDPLRDFSNAAREELRAFGSTWAEGTQARGRAPRQQNNRPLPCLRKLKSQSDDPPFLHVILKGSRQLRPRV